MMRFTLILAALTAFSQSEQTTTPVGQPIAFSHKQHATSAHLKCGDCHKLADSGEVVSIPTGESCMSCHKQIAKNSPAIIDLAAYVSENQPVPWVRIYELPSFVEFNHRDHLNSRVTCVNCHGAVATRDRLWRETDVSMGGCVTCHRSSQASTNCSTCHHLEDY